MYYVMNLFKDNLKVNNDKYSKAVLKSCILILLSFITFDLFEFVMYSWLFTIMMLLARFITI